MHAAWHGDISKLGAKKYWKASPDLTLLQGLGPNPGSRSCRRLSQTLAFSRWKQKFCIKRHFWVPSIPWSESTGCPYPGLIRREILACMLSEQSMHSSGLFSLPARILRPHEVVPNNSIECDLCPVTRAEEVGKECLKWLPPRVLEPMSLLRPCHLFEGYPELQGMEDLQSVLQQIQVSGILRSSF